MTVHRLLLGLALLATALAAGFFYTYSISVMPALAAADPLVAVRAMQSINATIRTVAFALVFFGALILPVAAALAGWAGGARRAPLLSLAAGIAYGAGVFAVTMLVNVPLNDALAAVGPSPGDPAKVWLAYDADWRAWNHLRAVAAAVAFLLHTAAAIAEATARRT